LRQRNVRRMLAYSSVAHSGYILTAFAALQGAGLQTAVQAVLIYAAAYAVMNLGAFFVIDLVGEETKSFNGLFRTRPGVALSMAIFMAALVGIPPFSGFFGKAWIIAAGAQSGAVIVYVAVAALVVNSVLSVPYYFGIIRNMFFEEAVTDAGRKESAGAPWPSPPRCSPSSSARSRRWRGLPGCFRSSSNPGSANVFASAVANIKKNCVALCSSSPMP
jgi:NADH-quinone oxidoreductase subunit N